MPEYEYLASPSSNVEKVQRLITKSKKEKKIFLFSGLSAQMSIEKGLLKQLILKQRKSLLIPSSDLLLSICPYSAYITCMFKMLRVGFPH